MCTCLYAHVFPCTHIHICPYLYRYMHIRIFYIRSSLCIHIFLNVFVTNFIDRSLLSIKRYFLSEYHTHIFHIRVYVFAYIYVDMGCHDMRRSMLHWVVVCCSVWRCVADKYSCLIYAYTWAAMIISVCMCVCRYSCMTLIRSAPWVMHVYDFESDK